MKKFKLITKILIFAVTFILIAWDIVVYREPTPGDTISEIFMGWSWRFSALPFAWGVLAGHLTWPQRSKVRHAIPRVIFVAAVALGLLLLNVFVDPFDIIPIIPMAVGIPCGRLFWPQEYPEGHPLFFWKR